MTNGHGSVLHEAIPAEERGLEKISRLKQHLERLDQQPCPPDPEMDAIFEDFAEQMIETGVEPVDFVEEVVEEHTEEPDGFFAKIIKKNIAGYKMGKAGRVLPTPSEIAQRYEKDKSHKVHSHRVVNRGWAIRSTKTSGTIMHSHEDQEKVEAWVGLAVDINGRVWFARDAKAIKNSGKSWHHFTTDAVAVSGSMDEYRLYDPPLNGNLIEHLLSDVTPAIAKGAETVKDEFTLKRREPKLGQPTGRSLRETILWYCGIRNVPPEGLPNLLAMEMAKMIHKAREEDN